MSANPSKDFLTLLSAAAERGALRRLVLSRPQDGDTVKITGKLCAFRGATVLATEASKKDGKKIIISSRNEGYRIDEKYRRKG